MIAGIPIAATLSPDGRTAYSFAPEKPVVAAYDLASGRRTDFSHAGIAKPNLAASPDGRSIAFVTTDVDLASSPVHLCVADADGRNVRTIMTTADPDDLPKLAGTLKWSPDSRFLYFVHNNEGSLWRIAANGGTPTLVGELAKGPVRTIDITPDGKRVIFGTD